jgi:hypothetical protein
MKSPTQMEKIYIGKDLTSGINYFGSADDGLFKKDFTSDQRRDFTIRQQVLWESEIATGGEVNKKEVEFIISQKANNHVIGYNQLPKFKAED